MEKIETLLKLEMGIKFDTRKTLNRSEKTVPTEILEQIESGNFTSEMIAELSQTYPIFRYQTQITIHGIFSEITRRSIGRYKNIFLNGNESLGVKYSAIDTEKIRTIRTLLENAGKCPFYYMQNSTDRIWRMSESINAENKVQLVEKYKTIAEIISKVNIYGFINMYISPTLFGTYFINLDIHPLAIPENQVQNFVYSLLWCNDSEYLQLCEHQTIKQNEQKEINRIESEKRNAENLRIDALKKQAYSAQKEKSGFGEIVPLSITNIIAKINMHEIECGAGKYEFVEYVFYKISDKGKFGKYQIQISRNAKNKPGIWENYKQCTISDCEKIKGYLVYDFAAPMPVSVVQKDNTISLVQYSDKSIAIIGETYPIRKILSDNGGKFNGNLSCGKGWIFPKTKETILKQLLNL